MASLQTVKKNHSIFKNNKMNINDIKESTTNPIIDNLLLELGIIVTTYDTITLAQVQTYLRDYEDFIVTIQYLDDNKYEWSSYWNNYTEEIDDEVEFDTYEEALLDGLTEALIDLKAWKAKFQEE